MKPKRNNQTVQEEGNKNRRNTIITVIITGIFSLIAALLVFFKSDTAPAPSKIQVNDNDGQITNVEGDYHDNRTTVDVTPEKISYNVTGIADERFIAFLKHSTKLNISPTSENEVKITYSNEITPMINSTDIFYYGGGNVIIQLNGNTCTNITTMRIEELRPNSRSNIERTLIEIVSNHVAKNKILFKDEILKCVQ